MWTRADQAVQVSAGVMHTCIRDRAGRVQCKGLGQSGAAFVPLDAKATDVSAGLEHTCAVADHGDVWCWGRNSWGQLGDGADGGMSSGTPAVHSGPVRVVDLHGVREVHASVDHTCSVSLTGMVECWGSNQFTALGYGALADISDFWFEPVAATSIGGSVLALAARASHSCVIMSDGELRCWGSNAYGSVGDGTLEDRFAPVTVSTFR